MSLIGALKSTGRYLESGDLGRRALNVASLGTYMHPADTENYLKSTLASFDPRTRAGLVDLAGILVPGSRKGMPTFAQMKFLDSIRQSSRGIPDASFSVHPSVNALSEHIGSPGIQSFGLPVPNLFTALNAMGVLRRMAPRGSNPSSYIGNIASEPSASAFGGLMPGSVEEMYQTMPQDQILTNALVKIMSGGRRN